MKLGVLLSGGKDSLYAAYRAVLHGYELTCLLTIKSTNSESYMFHTPNIDGVDLQAQAMQLPLLTQQTTGEKEQELNDLRQLLQQAKDKHHIEGVVTGAVGSQYQASRIQRLCYELELYCFNPLWQHNQLTLLTELLEHQFHIIYTGVAAYPLTEEWLGKQLNTQTIAVLENLQNNYHLNPAGEGGELESFVLDCPLFKKKICIENSKQNYENHAGSLHITQARLEEKEPPVLPVLKHLEQQKADVCIINCVAPELSLHEEEFIRPLVEAVQELGKTARVAPLSTVKVINEPIIIISGCGLRDDAFLSYKKNILQRITNKQVLGICAGAELLLPQDHELEEVLEIGPYPVEALQEDILTQHLDGDEVYFLHHLGLRTIPLHSKLQGLLTTTKSIAAFKYPKEPVYGVQFHPEVRTKQLLHQFIQL